MRILAIGNLDNGEAGLLDTTTGEVKSPKTLGRMVVNGEGGLLAGCNLYNHVGRLIDMFKDFPGWTVQVQSRERRLVKGTGRLVIGSFLPIYFGFVTPNGRNGTKDARPSGTRGKRKNLSRLFHCMDLMEIVGVRSVTLSEAVDYAQSILDLCEQRGVTFNATRGALATRLLKASPRWELDRRASPRFVNDHVREHLPGNYYGLGAPTRKRFKAAIYVDQVSSHHNVALTTPLPHPHHIRARGHHRTLHRPWLMATDKGFHEFLETHIGLIAGMVSVGHIPDNRKHLFPPFMHEPGRKLRYLYTNEVQYLDGKHGTLEWITAAWTANTIDPVIPEYAQWALNHRNEGPGRKPLLLAAYGSLAQRTDRPLTLYMPWRGIGMRTVLPGATEMKEVVKHFEPNQPQPRVINVLARGIIEAETRKRSILYAREMEERGIPVLSVYVDGLILDTDRLPFIAEGWEIEAHLTNLVFQHPNSFTAEEMSKQPGIPYGARTPSESARMMAAAGVTPTPEGIARRKAKREADSNRLLQQALWRERQGVV